MQELRNQFYTQIETLENELKGFDCNEYGVSEDPQALAIREQIGELETKISETWTN